MPSASGRVYLFSVDLEDVRLGMRDGILYRDRVAINTRAYLAWLAKHGATCTFFVVGNVAENDPDLIADIAAAGHEIACHTSEHVPLDQRTPESFRDDLARCLAHLRNAGATDVVGFRAPSFSLTEKTAWAHDVLAEMGFRYSSSVLPAKNPLYGWEGFGESPRYLSSGLLEIPMTVARIGPLTMPYGGGVYFRALPSFILRSQIRRHTTQDNPLLGYFHPYDIDTDQEYFMHPDINGNRFFNALLYHNREAVFPRLDMLMREGFRICTYRRYMETLMPPAPSVRPRFAPAPL